jgi:hypothetical protein
VQRISLVEEASSRKIRMANLAIVGSHSTNGVSAVHSKLLRTTTVKDLAEMFPERFSNKTNGVTPRRWLLEANTQDNEVGWLDWSQLQSNKDIFQFFKEMIAFRRNHLSLSRSRFWREDVSWYGVGPTVDLSHDSHSLAFCLHGASQGDDDIYVMLNAYWEQLEFSVQEGTAQEWKRIVDTALPSPDDFSDDGIHLERAKYILAPRSIVVLCRPKKSHTREGP